MGEALTTNPDVNVQPAVNSPEQVVAGGSLSYRERLSRGLGRVVEGGMSLVDMGAGIVLALDDLRLTRGAMRRLDEPFGGIIARQAEADPLSMDLESDIILDFRRDAQVAGFTDVDAMPAEQRAEVAAQSVGARTSDIAAEIAAIHPEWTADEVDAAVAARTADISALLGMDEAQRDAYLAAQLEYHDLRSAIPEIQAELDDLRAERNERLRHIGGAALRGVVNFAGRLRDVPTAVGARAMLAGMSLGDRLGSMRPETRRKAFWGTAAGVAIAGLAGYVAMRAGVGHGGGGYTLVDAHTALKPGNIGTNLPDYIGTPTSAHAGNGTLPDYIGNVSPDYIGTANPQPTIDYIGTPAGAHPSPDYIGTVSPDYIGTKSGSVTPDYIGTAAKPPVRAGGGSATSPDYIGTGATSPDTATGVKTSDHLFASSAPVNKWPDVITVSRWDPHDLDGSLTGIAHQMLVRSGVHQPSQLQVNALVDSLRPQARPNGYLLYGQKLDLRPAAKALQGILHS